MICLESHLCCFFGKRGYLLLCESFAITSDFPLRQNSFARLLCKNNRFFKNSKSFMINKTKFLSNYSRIINKK